PALLRHRNLSPTPFFLQSPAPHRHLHSFPTRRSSDLKIQSAEYLTVFQNRPSMGVVRRAGRLMMKGLVKVVPSCGSICRREPLRSEEHTSELQSLTNLVCRLLLEKKKEQRNEQHSFLGAVRNARDGTAVMNAGVAGVRIDPAGRATQA